jgi:hypothetical protein
LILTNLTDTVTNLPVISHILAPSLLDDKDIEPGPTSSPSPEQYNLRERDRKYQELILAPSREDNYSDGISSIGAEFQYQDDSGFEVNPPLSDKIDNSRAISRESV